MKIKAIFFITFIFSSINSYANSSSCSLVDGINVYSAKHILNICKHGTVIKTFKVALGYKGMGKKKTGDNKTPIGLYRLAYPRKSSQFKVFIPILYPTSRQLAAGYTGSDVGIHGPTQLKPWFSWVDNLPSFTRGCVAVGKNNQIEYVANWVKANPGTKLLII